MFYIKILSLEINSSIFLTHVEIFIILIKKINKIIVYIQDGKLYDSVIISFVNNNIVL